MFNYSFWADEAYISGIAAQLVLGKLSFLQAITIPGIEYQRLHMLIITFFFRLFGISEFTARLPSVLGYLLGIIVIFYLTKRLSNIYGGIMSAFLYGFSHLHLSYATQAKPYITIEAILLSIVYLLSEKKKVNHLLIIILCSVATLLHSIGVFLWIVYFVSIVQKFKSLKVQKWNVTYILIAVLALGAAGYFILPMVPSLFSAGSPFRYNNIYQIVKLFTYKYAIITLCGFVGFVWTSKKNKELHIGILLYSLVLFVFVAFVAYTFPIRYVLSLFGILFLYFGVFWAKVGERYDKKIVLNFKSLKVTGKAIVPLVVIILLCTTGYKIVRGPQAYYNPNIDKYGDIQIANYKDFYTKLKQKFPDYKNIFVINDTFDAEYWYFGRYSNIYFMKFTPTPHKHAVVNAYVYGSLDYFKEIIKEHPQGLLIMEDWQSFLPDDIKDYAKKNLRLELRVESLREAKDDPWPLTLYSWGMPVQKLEGSKVQK